MAFALPLLAIAGTAITAIGTIQQGIAQKNALNYQSQVAQNNAITAQNMAQNASEAAQAKAAGVAMKEAEVGGQIKAAQAAGGVDVNTGSNKAVQISQRELGKLDTETTLSNEELKAYGYRTQAQNFQSQAGLYAYEAPQALTGAEFSAAGTALGSASKWFGPPTSLSANSLFGGGSPSGYGT
jgi:hypothetical protein